MSIGWGQYDNTPPEVTDLFINTLSVDVTELFQIHHTTTGEWLDTTKFLDEKSNHNIMFMFFFIFTNKS